jgi:hypothetical protein
MTYIVGGTIHASDINEFVENGSPNLNGIWATGTGDSGYGQTPLSTVNVGDIVSQSPWNELVTNIDKAAAHQGSVISPLVPPITGDLISFLSSLSTNLSTVNDNRLNAAIQGGTTTSVSTSADTWTDKLTVTFTVTFASHNAARYFFNAGGQLGISASHPSPTSTGINQQFRVICSDAGTVWLSSPISGTVSLSSTPYSGVTKVGGGNPAGTTISTNSGFYSLTNTLVQLFKQTSNSSYYYSPGSFMSISASYNGTGVITIIVEFDKVPNGTIVSAGTVTILTVRSPSTNELTNTWGTPVLANSYTKI